MKLYAKFFSMHLRSVMQYKTSFFLMAIGQFITAFSAFLSVWFYLPAGATMLFGDSHVFFFV